MNIECPKCGYPMICHKLFPYVGPEQTGEIVCEHCEVELSIEVSHRGGTSWTDITPKPEAQSIQRP